MARILEASQLFLSPVLLRGTPEQKLRAAGAAGFIGIEFWHDDLKDIAGGRAQARRMLTENGLKITDLQLLVDFDGAPRSKREAKRREALELLDAAADLDAPVLAVTAATDPQCDRHSVTDDLAWLVSEASCRGVRISYEPMSWSVTYSTLPDAWAAVRELDAEVIGLVVDSYHIFSKGRTADDLDGIPADRIFAVQLADARLPIPADHYKDVARTHRLLPGSGDFPLASLVATLADIRYGGPVGIEVFNTDLADRDPGPVAEQAMAALTALLDDGR